MQLCHCRHLYINLLAFVLRMYTVRPLNKGHLGDIEGVLY